MSAIYDDSTDPSGRPLTPPRNRELDTRTGGDAVVARIRHQSRWVVLPVQHTVERGEFDNLPGQRRRIGDLGSPRDRDWWLKKLIERERITGVLPAALELRMEDAELETLLDQEAVKKCVRETVEDCTRRVIEARRRLRGGPPVVTATHDVEREEERWQGRRAACRARVAPAPRPGRSRPRWRSRRDDR